MKMNIVYLLNYVFQQKWKSLNKETIIENFKYTIIKSIEIV